MKKKIAQSSAARTRKRLGILLSAFGVLLVPLAVQPGTHAAGCTVINSLPFTIQNPGSYCLSDNLTTTSQTGPAISIVADNVLLDLNGYTISSGSFPPDSGITSSGRSVTIRNGTLKGFAEAIRSAGRFGVIEKMRIQDCYFIGINVYYSNGTVVRDNQVVNTAGTSSIGGGVVSAISVSGSSNIILNNDIVETLTSASASADAIDLNPSDRTVVENNRIEHTTGTAIYVSSNSSNAVVVNNRIVRASQGVWFRSSTGLFRDNIALGCTTPYSGGANGGNNQ